jgi:hypothetical protein
MATRPNPASVTMLLIWCLFLSASAFAQLIDTKDASEVSVKSASPSLEPVVAPVADEGQAKDCFVDHYDGAVIPEHPEKIRLEIVSADTHFVDDTTELTVIVRIKNDGHWAILLPWETDAVEPEKTGGPNDEVRYEAASLRLKLGTQENRVHGAFLQGRLEFQANPHSYEQSVRLLPGQWVEVKLKALAKCLYDAAEPPLCSEFKADEHGHLTAHWSEWRFTTQRVQGCNDISSSEKARMIDSGPVEIDFLPASPLGGSTAHIGVPPHP